MRWRVRCPGSCRFIFEFDDTNQSRIPDHDIAGYMNPLDSRNHLLTEPITGSKGVRGVSTLFKATKPCPWSNVEIKLDRDSDRKADD